MNGASVVRLVLIITPLYLNAYLATLNITLASGLHKTNHESPCARFPAAAGAGAGASSPPSSYWSGVRCGNSLGASNCLVLPTIQSVQYCKGNYNCILGCAVASREKTKYRCRPMTTKLHFTCLILLNSQWWTNWVLTGDHSALILLWSNKKVSQRIILMQPFLLQ